MTKQLQISCITSLGLFLAASPALVAQVTTGQISGRVTDPNNKPLRAKVVLTAPQLMSQREITTDANGEWRAALLPPGDYVIKISAEGHVGTTARNIRIGAGAALRHDSVLKVISVASETVEIGGSENVVVDKTDTKTAISFSADLLAQMTGSRDFYGAIDLAVGVTYGASGDAQVRGGTVNSTLYRLDGADIKDPFQGQVDATWYVEDQIEDIAIVLSPLNARYGRTLGGSIDVVTKSGGNQFSGTFRVNAGRSNWGGKGRDYLDYPYVNDSLSSRAQEYTLGGPIIKDRLWFSFGTSQRPSTLEEFRAARPLNSRNEMLTRWYPGRISDGPTLLGDPPDTNRPGPYHSGLNALLAVDPNTRQVLPTAAPQIQGYYFPTWLAWTDGYFMKQTASFYSAKVTLGINPDHKVAIGGQYQPWEFTNSGSGQYRQDQFGTDSYMAQGFNFAYNGIWGAKTFTEVKFSRQKQTNRWKESDRKLGAWANIVEIYTDRLTGAQQWNGPFRFLGTGNAGPEERNNLIGSANVTMYRDLWNMNHNIDVGMEFFQGDRHNNLTNGPDNMTVRTYGVYEKSDGDWLFPTLKWVGNTATSGNNMWGQSSTGNTGYAINMWKCYGEPGAAKNTNLALYFNDQMTINDHWNVMLGLRYDKVDSKNVDGSKIFSTSEISPRFVLTYDLKGDSAHVFRFNYSRMTLDYPFTLTDRFTKGPTSVNVGWVWTGAAINQPAPGTVGDIIDGREMYGLRFVTLEQLYNLANYTVARSFSDNSKQYSADQNLKPMTNDEFAIEYRRSYQGGSYIRAAYVFRVQGNIWTGTYDYSPEYWVVLKDPSNSGLRDQYGMNQTYFNTTELWRDYHGLEFEVMTRINSIFSWSLAYNYSRLRGNSEAGDSTSSFGDFSPPGYFTQQTYLNSIGVPMDQRSPTGALAGDYPHKVRASLLAVVPLGSKGSWISYSMTMGYDSGNNWSITAPMDMRDWSNSIKAQYDAIAAADPTKPTTSSTVPLTWSKWFSKRGDYHDNDTHWVNAQIAWEVPIWKKVKTMGNISIWNVFNMIYNYSYNKEQWNDYYYGQGYYSTLIWQGDRFGRTANANGINTYAFSPRSVSVSMGLKF